VEAEQREKELHKLQTIYDELERQRAPLKHEEANYVTAANLNSKTQQDVLAATVVIEGAIWRHLRTAPKIVKKTKSRGNGRSELSISPFENVTELVADDSRKTDSIQKSQVFRDKATACDSSETGQVRGRGS
jgi:hypothetical protein